MSTTHTYNLERFLKAQRGDYDIALREIKAGRKTSHWIWYIFPQLKGLGHSYNSQFYGIDGIEEAKAYYSHPVLGQRLRDITEALLTHKGQKLIEEIMGGSLDALKLRSCMELFDQVAPGSIFKEVLVAFYGANPENKASARSYEYNLDKVKGCIVGGAVGDALGYPVEFYDFFSILSKFGPSGITRYQLKDGVAQFSDDTQMTLFTATGLLAAESEMNLRGIGDDNSWAQHVAHHYIDWYWTQNSKPGKRHCSWLFEVPELHDRRAPGMTCMGSLRNIVQGIDLENNSKGCGGVMRVAPVALCNDLRESMSTDFMYSLGGAVADITHNNPLGFYPAAMLVMLLDKITKCGQEVNRKVLEKLVMACVREIGKVKLHDEGASDTYDKYPTAVGTLGRLMMLAVDFAGGDRPDEECIRELGGGWTGEEALAIAVYCALRHADSFEDAVVAAVNHSGDSDSTGAICGNIMGLIYGYHAIPQHFKDNLELLPVLEEVATDLYIGSARTDDLKSWKKKYLEGHRVQKVKSASWDSAAFIEEFNKWIRKPDTPENGVYPYEHVRRLRADEYKNTVQIVNAGKYITEDLKEVRLPDDSAMMTRTAFYEKSFKVTRLPAGKEETLFEVLNSDCLEAALTLLSSGYNPAVLNMASRKIPGGGVVGGAGAQEECLFRQTNLFRSLYQFVPEGRDYGVPSREEQYPLDRNYGGIYTPGATMFRESEAKGYRLMDKPIQLSFISVAAINHPALKDATHLDDSLVVGTKHKIKTILRIGLAHGHDSLVLSAFGCGAYRNPPYHMAQLFKEVFDDPEFKNKYRRVVFAIIDDHNARKAHNPEGNFKPFYDVFCDVSQC